MKGRVTSQGKGTISIRYDWNKFVEEPRKQGYYSEAFSSADAMLDDLIYRIFQLTYQTNDNFNLISFLKQPKIKSDDMLRLMREKKVVGIDEELVDLYGKFNRARNMVLHSPYAEYNFVIEKEQELIEKGQELKYKDNDEFYSLAVKEADDYLNKAYMLFTNLTKIIQRADKQPTAFFD